MISELKKRSLARGGISPALFAISIDASFDHVAYSEHHLSDSSATPSSCDWCEAHFITSDKRSDLPQGKGHPGKFTSSFARS
ncbi:hypothetical protein PISMIDRAFT_680906, partial [Pisolithus microcarpus 441]